MHDHEITCRGHGCDQSGQYPANLLLGFGVRVRSRMFINVLFADGVGHGSVGKTGLRGVNLIKITAQRGLRHLDALVGENLRQLRLRGDDARQQRLLNGAQSSGSCGRTLQRGSVVSHQTSRLSSPRALPANQVSNAFWACRRLPASSQTTD